MRHAEACQAAVGAPRIDFDAGQACREAQIFERRQVIFQAVEMSDKHQICAELLALPADREATPAHLSPGGLEQAAEDAQQAGLAAAVCPGYAQQLSGLRGKAQG